MACMLTTSSPTGDALCFISEQRVCRQQVSGHGHVLARNLGYHHSETRAVRWAADGSQCLIATDSSLKVFGAVDLTERVRLENGSGGIGKIVQAEFLDNDRLLVVWDFGKAKLWDLMTGKGLDLPDLKTTAQGRKWQLRPTTDDNRPGLLAMVSRNGSEDVLVFHHVESGHTSSRVRLNSNDAQAVEWSPDGRWLAIVDSPIASPSVHIHTADGHPFRSFSPTGVANGELGIKSLAWSPDGQVLALSRFDDRIELLNTRTFSPLATIEHSLLIDQRTLSTADQAVIWEENVSASNERSYTVLSQPISPPLTRSKAPTEPDELGVAEFCFSCDGTFLASRDNRMSNTVWVWNMANLSPYAVIIQHDSVRHLLWHPTRPDTLMIDCASSHAHIFNAASREAPTPSSTGQRPKAALSWVRTAANAKPVILVAEKTSYRLLYPYGRDMNSEQPRAQSLTKSGAFDEGASEDSLFDVLSGRKPLPPKTESSYTEMVDLDMNQGDTVDDALEDTFRAKKKPIEAEVPADPLDDSEFF